MNIHGTIKFWGRKDPIIFEDIIRKNSEVIDPFCGSGTTGYAAILKNSFGLLSDINPVSVFIAQNLLNGFYLNKKMMGNIRTTLQDIEKKYYQIDSGYLQKIVYSTYFICPSCGKKVVPNNNGGKLSCECGKKFWQREAEDIVEKIVEVVVWDGNKTKRIDPAKYKEEDSSTAAWYPKRKFIYEGNKKFVNLPNFGDRVDQIFFSRGLKAAAEVYEFINTIDDDETKDFLKFVFIASLISATKMLPYSKTSGPSWKLPRYWTPPKKIETDFIRAFIRRLNYLNKFKKEWNKYVKDYKIFVDYFGNINVRKEKYISITRCDARELEVPKTFDIAIMDPPHYGEIMYFEMTFLWQCWLYGKEKDKRFSDFSYWKKEIDVNHKVNRNLEYFNSELEKVVEKYLNFAPTIYLILHNSVKQQFKTTLQILQEKWDVEIKKIVLQVPTSAQGIHGKKKKYLYLLKIK